MTKTLNLTQIPPLHKTSFNGSALQLSNIEVNQDYLDEWNENCKDFVVLSKNGEILRNTLYRVGGLNNPKVGIDKYFMLLKYTEKLYTIDFIKKCYPKKTKKEQEKHLKHKNMNIDKMIQLRRSKIKVIHGTFAEEPKCKICNVDISHEWLGGDYTLLMCDKKECWDELNKRNERP